MIYIEKIYTQRKGYRMSLPPQLCREMGIVKKDQFLVFALDENTLVLQKITDKEIIENNLSLENLKSIIYGKQTSF
jgi:hypothetical protein